MDHKPAPESQTLHDLPMIVHLQGDEDFVTEFSIDAEEAMYKLGIKRSRLTQISGKELRVGRIRVDRYVRPMYRAKDIEDYQNWTRATATHQSASQILQSSVTEMLANLKDVSSSQTHIQTERLKTLQHALLQSFHMSTKRVLDEFKADMRKKNLEQEQGLSTLQRVLKLSYELQESLNKLHGVLQDEWGTNRELFESMHKDWRESQQQVAKFKKDLLAAAAKNDDALSTAMVALESINGRLDSFEQILSRMEKERVRKDDHLQTLRKNKLRQARRIRRHIAKK